MKTPGIATICAILLSAETRILAAEPAWFGLQLDKVQNIRGLRVPLGRQADAKPTLAVYFGKITVESKKAGFLRIGPIPQPVVTGLRLEIMEAEGGIAWGADFLKFATSEAALEKAEIRGIEIRGAAKDSVTVSAEMAYFVPRSGMIQLRGVQVQAEGRVLHQSALGEVHLHGEKAGRLVWDEGGRIRSILLGAKLPVVVPVAQSAVR